MRDDSGHPADLRRQRHRPHPGPGLRARPGAVLRDGPPPARHGRAALRARRRARGRRPTSSSARWAGAGWPSRSCRPWSPRPGRRSWPTPRGSTGTSRPQPGRGLARVHRARPVDADRATSRSGRPSTRWPGSRRWRGTCAATTPTRSRAPCSRPPQPRADRPALPRVPARPAPADRLRRGVATRPGAGGVGAAVLARGRRDRGRRGPRAVDPECPGRVRGRPAGAGRDAGAPRDAATGSAPTPGSWRGHGPRRASRCSPTTRTSASASPGIWMPDGPALPRGRRRLPPRRRRASPSPGCPASSSATTRTSPGASPTSAPTSPTSTWSRSSATTYQRDGDWVPLRVRTRRSRSPAERTSDDHDPLHRARPDHVRRAPARAGRPGRERPDRSRRGTTARRTPSRWRGPALLPGTHRGRDPRAQPGQ